MSFSRGLKIRAADVWEEAYQHPFVQELGKGTLDKGKFQFYLLQDYHYLLEYAKVFAAAVVKAPNEAMMIRLTKVQHSILAEEMDLHRRYMVDFGISQEQIQNTRPSLFNRTYTANLLATAKTGDLAEILACVFPCAWTYSDFAQRLTEQYADKLADNFYQSWINNYADMDFAESYEWFYDAIDELVDGKNCEQRDRVAEIFVSSVEFEYLFWDMAYKEEMAYRL